MDNNKNIFLGLTEIDGKKYEIYNEFNISIELIYSKMFSQVFFKEYDLLMNAWKYVEESYSEPNRFYHTKEHIISILTDIINNVSLSESDKVLLSLAAIFHDAIYDKKNTDAQNVQASALLFVSWFKENKDNLTDYQDMFEVIYNLILATSTHNSNYFLSKNPHIEKLCYLFLDLDLKILASTPEIYKQYVENIRKEYNQFTDEEFLKGRLEFCNTMLNKVFIFKSMVELNVIARENLNNEKQEILKQLGR